MVGMTGERDGSGMSRPFLPAAEGSGSRTAIQEPEVAAAEEALLAQDWATARGLWQQLACAVPQDRHFRAQLTYARAGELLAAGETQRAREELERVLRIEPAHPGATSMLKKASRGALSRLFGR